MKKSLLFLAPLPPPIDGQSKACARVLNSLRTQYSEVYVINLRREKLQRNILTEIARIISIFKFLYELTKVPNKLNDVYLSISESFFGNLKDIFIYCFIWGNMNNLTVHMLGGSGMNRLMNQTSIRSKINAFFLKRAKRLIVEGETGRDIFKNFVDERKIYIIPNFIESYLLVTPQEIAAKFSGLSKIKVLYLSNMFREKGYHDLLTGFNLLPYEIRARFELTFVGSFPVKKDKTEFLQELSGVPNIHYLGDFIDGYQKRKLYLESHLFCLPTYYPYEGQPISILEAYGTGCVVLATSHGGIGDIFYDQKNGFRVNKKDPESIKDALMSAYLKRDRLFQIALRNFYCAAEKYQSGVFDERIFSIFEKS